MSNCERGGMVGKSNAFQNVLKLLARIADYDVPVLVHGETGTGKELAAHAIHHRGARRNNPFVPVNCGAIPDLLLENELFGHHKGAFTDAREDQLGLITLANTGTLFLDEVDALSSKAQVSLLRFLQDQHFRPLGSRHELTADVRVIAATNADLHTLVDSGQFRQDLLYRLKILSIELPPLRERKGDPAYLAEHFMSHFSLRFGLPCKKLDTCTADWFDQYSWPGNVRELENIVCREFLLGDGATLQIDPDCLGGAGRPSLQDPGPEASENLDYASAKAIAMRAFEVGYLARLMEKTKGNVSAAARLAGKERRAFGRLIKKHGIDKARFGP
ncbi:Transcriptional regulatory protein QseF [Anaerolineae bacterium]|nr:Transcriptional regulatory protein QseF [Anaerolineae bacterium]